MVGRTLIRSRDPRHFRTLNAMRDQRSTLLIVISPNAISVDEQRAFRLGISCQAPNPERLEPRRV
jgi:hypothetical protein